MIQGSGFRVHDEGFGFIEYMVDGQVWLVAEG